MKHQLSKTNILSPQNGKLEHLNRNIPSLAHTPMYVWHKFWSRKTWNVVAEYIKTYSKENDIVFDPFEVESTTSMTSALLRGSNLERDIPKYIVIPEEREIQLNNKMSSPLFEQHFNDENWKVLYFDSIRNAYLKFKADIDLDYLYKESILRDDYNEYKKKQIEFF